MSKFLKSKLKDIE